ncbi:MAG TPA: hypothetical protein PKC19_12120 [Roseiflexaceae bacterium]|nr:hypothetical protein [Roseiflexaceae bacterium]
MTQPPPNPPVLPFDQHGRYQMVAEALEAARPVIRAQLRVLDVGGLALEATTAGAALPARR